MANKKGIYFVLTRPLAAIGGMFVSEGTEVQEVSATDTTRTFETNGRKIVVERGSAAEKAIKEKRD